MFCAMSLVFEDQTKLVIFRYLQESSHFATCRKQGQIKPSGVLGRLFEAGFDECIAIGAFGDTLRLSQGLGS